ncbi:MAG TPA: hypothetical protein PLP99_08200 [Ignavibacteriales bacterium]|nr:hypothetical protein [Ignavibacteriales bacterium]HOL81721.1 hypothetical protein [Ignavibacteriales bacterium]HOM66289.1 hypothetical protein [Ignavibacteriales bacterium]HPP34443.1 hypothetical protein [Ignavibacteriales bacterium]HRR19605.1 hypothetical protein [Ignavibacteriales bacterium]
MQVRINNYQIEKRYNNELLNIVEKKNLTQPKKEENVTVRSKKDELILSPEVQELLKNNQKVINPGDSRFKPLFERFGIDTTKDVSLLVYIDGKIVVTNAHPDQSKIETLLNNDNELSRAIRNSLGISIFPQRT